MSICASNNSLFPLRPLESERKNKHNHSPSTYTHIYFIYIKYYIYIYAHHVTYIYTNTLYSVGSEVKQFFIVFRILFFITIEQSGGNIPFIAPA